jgi:hypothetical protein
VDPYAWSWNPETIVILGFAVAYILTLRRYPVPVWRIACFGGAVVLLVAVAVTPIHTLGMHFLLTMHLLQNVVLAEWAPLLVVLGLPRPLQRSLLGRRRSACSHTPRLPSPSGSRTTWSGTSPRPTTRRSGTRTRFSISSTRCTSSWRGDVVVRSTGRAAPSRLRARAGYVFAAFVLGSPIGLVMALVPNAIYASTSRHTTASG